MSLREDIARVSDASEIILYDRRRLLEENTLSNRALVRSSNKTQAAARTIRETLVSLNKDLQSSNRDSQEGLSQLIASNERQEETLQDITNGVWDISDGIKALGSAFTWGIAEVLHQFETQRQELRQIVEVLEAPLETQAKELKKRAEDAYENGWIDEALTDFLEAEKKNYTDFTIHQNIGNIYHFEKSEPGKALEYYNKAARYAHPRSAFHTSYALLHVGLARYLGNLEGGVEGAYEATREATELNPDFLQAHYEHARYCALLGKKGEALTHLVKAIEGDKNYCWKLVTDPAFNVIRAVVEKLLRDLRNAARKRVEELLSVAKSTLAELPLEEVKQYKVYEFKLSKKRPDEIEKKLATLSGYLDILNMEAQAEACVSDMFGLGAGVLSSRQQERIGSKLSILGSRVSDAQKKYDDARENLRQFQKEWPDFSTNLFDVEDLKAVGAGLGVGIGIFVLLVGLIGSFVGFLVVASTSIVGGMAAPRIIRAQGSASREREMTKNAQKLREAQEIDKKAQERFAAIECIYRQWLALQQQLQVMYGEIIGTTIAVQSKVRERFVQKAKGFVNEIRQVMKQQYAPGRVCPSCGGEIEQTATSCEFCGQNCQSRESTPHMTPSKESPNAAPKAEVREASKARYCERCGTQADPGAKFCETCGTALG